MKFIATIIFLVAGTYVSAQSLTQTIKGRLVDQQSKSPIIGATILVKDSEPMLGAVTDLEGYFRLPSVPIGRHVLIFSSVGYEVKTHPNVLVTSGKEVYLEVEMVESLVEMAAVEIVASNKQDKGQPMNEMATVSAISLSVEETSRYAATFDDPARAAASQAGVTTGGDDLLNEIVIRGNSPKGILWRLEGVEIPNPNHFNSVGSSAGGVSMLSANVLNSSDFFTGAFPAQYGNATSGIFDLNLRKGNFDKQEHSFQVGLLGIGLASEGPLSKNSNASYLINYRYSTLALFEHLGIDILGDQEDITFQDLSFKVFVPTEKAGTFSLWGLGGANTYGYKADTVNTNDFYFEDESQWMGATGLTHIVYLGADTYLKSIVSYSGNRNDYSEDSLRLQVWYTEDFTESQFRVSSFLNHKFNARSTLRVGGIYSRLGFNLKSQSWYRDQERFITILDEKGNAGMYQGFAQVQHRFTQDFSVNVGGHLTYFGLNHTAYVEPRAGMRWQLTPKGALTGGVGLHSRKESIALYLAREFREDGSAVYNNKNLKFTKAAHAVVGYELMLKPDLKLKSEVYYQHLYDVPVWPNDTVSNMEALTFSSINSYDGYTTVPLANKGTGRNYGVELTLEKYFTNNYYFMTTGSLYQSKYTAIDGVERNTVFNGNYIFNALGGREFAFKNGQRVLSINSRLIYAGGKRESPVDIEASRAAGYTIRDYSRTYEDKIPAYFRLDLGVSYKWNKIRSATVVAINVQNVLGIENVAFTYYGAETDRVWNATQLGMFPNLSYKVEF
ncbi:TonB-dependent receptor [Marinoscillum sp.]|uniref:TonB-dependent receptor n=1 Tax=Marinoscillum sp. TaxID=2024838 RepID=UPI003BAAECF7